MKFFATKKVLLVTLILLFPLFFPGFGVSYFSDVRGWRNWLFDVKNPVDEIVECNGGKAVEISSFNFKSMNMWGNDALLVKTFYKVMKRSVKFAHDFGGLKIQWSDNIQPDDSCFFYKDLDEARTNGTYRNMLERTAFIFDVDGYFFWVFQGRR